MLDSILIGVDGLAGGRDAIALATGLAGPGARFTLAHVDTGPGLWWGQYVGEERVFDRSASMLAAERERAGIPAAIVCLGGRTPARGLHDLARERAADLIVVGSSRHGPLGRVLLGDDARETLEEAPCAVAIAPHGHAHTVAPPIEIGVAYDGLRESEQALATARELAGRSGAKIRAACVEGVDVGSPKELFHFSSELDLLIVGARVGGSLERMIHDSASRLAGHTPCPVLVLTPVAIGVDSPVVAA
jgi:nucleotide-binding universal stress UspA family protein